MALEMGKGEAVPFTLTLDLRSVNELDKLEYLPREDGGNGNADGKGTISYSTDRQTWSKPIDFAWNRDGATKTFTFEGNPSARYIRLNVTEAAGNFASGRQMYVFKVPGSESILQGDIKPRQAYRPRTT